MGVAYRVSTAGSLRHPRRLRRLYLGLPMRTLLAQFSQMPPSKRPSVTTPTVAAQSPDGNNSYLLTHAPAVHRRPQQCQRRRHHQARRPRRWPGRQRLGAGLPSARIHEWNVALEKEIGHSMVMRVKYDGKHAINLDQTDDLNVQAPDYIWYTPTSPSPTGTLAVGCPPPMTRPAYTTIRIFEKTGISNSQMFRRRTRAALQPGSPVPALLHPDQRHAAGRQLDPRQRRHHPRNFLPGAVPPTSTP